MFRPRPSIAALLAVFSLTAACTEILGHYEVTETGGGGGPAEDETTSATAATGGSSGGAPDCDNSGSHEGPGDGCGGDSSGKGP